MNQIFNYRYLDANRKEYVTPFCQTCANLHAKNSLKMEKIDETKYPCEWCEYKKTRDENIIDNYDRRHIESFAFSAGTDVKTIQELTPREIEERYGLYVYLPDAGGPIMVSLQALTSGTSGERHGDRRQIGYDLAPGR